MHPIPMAVEDLGPLTVRVPMNMLLILARADWTVFVFRLFAPDLRDEVLQFIPTSSSMNSKKSSFLYSKDEKNVKVAKEILSLTLVTSDLFKC